MGSGAIERKKVATADRRIGPCEVTDNERLLSG